MHFGKKIVQTVRFQGNKTTMSFELEKPSILLEELFEYLLISNSFAKLENIHFKPLLSKDLCNICGVK